MRGADDSKSRNQQLKGKIDELGAFFLNLRKINGSQRNQPLKHATIPITELIEIMQIEQYQVTGMFA